MIKQKKHGLLYYLGRHKFSIGLYVFLMVADSLISVVNTLFAAYFLASITDGNFDQSLIYLIVFSSCLIAQILTQVAQSYLYYHTTDKISLEIKKSLVGRMFNLSSKTFSDKAMGQFIQRVDNDPHTTLRMLDNVIYDLANVFRYSVIIIYIAVYNYIIALLLIGGMIIICIVEYINVRHLRKNQKAENLATEEATSLTSEIARSERDIKSLNLASKLNLLADQRYGHQNKVTRHKLLVYTNFTSFRDFLVVSLSFAILLLGLFLVKEVALSLAAFLFIYTNKDSIRWVVTSVGRIASNVAKSKISAQRMFEIFDEEKFPSEKFGDVEKQLTGNIEFKNVVFGYTDENDEKKLLFNDLNFKIPANKTVAFVGKSGSGKTTILNLISKLSIVDSGEILHEGIEIRQLDKPSIRNNISLVNQFPYIFNTSIEENLLMANEGASHAEIVEACKSASFDKFVNTLPNKYKTKVGEGGVKLSGGQKQRLAIARAFLRKSKIILFDESTSSLDNETQEEIKQSIAKLSGQSTVIIVAHRLSTIKNADIIYFIDDGEIKGQGSFNSLIKTNEAFASLFKVEQI